MSYRQSLWLIVQSIVCYRLLILLSHLLICCQTADTAVPGNDNDQIAGGLVARLLRAEP